jgi:hypothetical protein
MRQLFTIIALFLRIYSFTQKTNIVILDKNEVENFRETIRKVPAAKEMYDSGYSEAINLLNNQPRPLEVVHYEGLLDTNPKRINTMKSIADIDHVVTFIYAGYGNDNPQFGEKSKEIILAWAEKYIPTSNPINENKFTAFFWAYHLYKELWYFIFIPNIGKKQNRKGFVNIA